MLLALGACAGPQVTLEPQRVSIRADGSVQSVQVAGGATVAQAIAAAGLTLGALDRISPPLFALASAGSEIVITRVREEFEIERVILPFSQQTVRSEMLATGTRRLLQAGRNGLEEVTYSVRIEDSLEVSRAPIRRVVIEEPVPEIILAGAQAQSATVNLPGTLAYLETGSAWIMRGTSRERQAIALTGDMDGRVFALSPDGSWLAATRTGESGLNALWLYSTLAEEPVSPGVSNIVHPASFSPLTPSTLAFSTVEPSPSAPGWKANNDLVLLPVGDTPPASAQKLVAAQVGGRYGWWGTSYEWAPQGTLLAYRRPDGVGVIDARTGRTLAAFPITPFVSATDWVWVPGVAWSADARFLYTVAHAGPLGLEVPESSAAFDLVAIPVNGHSQAARGDVCQSGPLSSALERRWRRGSAGLLAGSATARERGQQLSIDGDGSGWKQCATVVSGRGRRGPRAPAGRLLTPGEPSGVDLSR
jgi:resuscitation-promoting factor RpfB